MTECAQPDHCENEATLIAVARIVVSILSAKKAGAPTERRPSRPRRAQLRDHHHQDY